MHSANGFVRNEVIYEQCTVRPIRDEAVDETGVAKDLGQRSVTTRCPRPLHTYGQKSIWSGGAVVGHKQHAGRSISSDAGSDGHLIELVRGGDVSAFDSLYERHVAIASTVARRNVDNPSDAEDVVAEAFQSVLQSLMNGKGPDTFFRAYLLSTVTRLSHHGNRKAGKVLPSGEDSMLDHAMAEPDAVVRAFESHTVAKAFRALPERWQAVLWYVDVERMKPATVAPLLGLSSNAVSALALRAREGLRRLYLQFHIAEQPDPYCVEYASKLGTFIRGGFSSATERKVRDHLDGCSKCTAALAELQDVQGSMRAVLLPLMTGIPLAAWAGKGAGLGIIGGIFPGQMALAVPVLAQPAVMAIVAAAAVGLVLGSMGIVDHLTPDAYMQQPAVETEAYLLGRDTGQPAPVPTETSTPDASPSVPVETPPPVVLPEPPVQESVPEPLSTPVPVPPTTTSPSPIPSPAPSTTPPVAAPVNVEASAWPTRRWGSGASDLVVDFRVSGTKPLANGKAVFSVGPGGWLRADSVRAPEGWTCSSEGQSVVTCVTNSAPRDELRFYLDARSKRHKDKQVLTYALNGTGITPSTFTYSY